MQQQSDRPLSFRFGSTQLLNMVGACALVGAGWLMAGSADAAELVCRKVVSETVTGEGRNSALASRVKCPPGEMMTGGTCYSEVRPEEDGSCQTSAMGIIQPIMEHPDTTEEAFFSCLQTGGTDCPIKERTRAMAICCKVAEAAPAKK